MWLKLCSIQQQSGLCLCFMALSCWYVGTQLPAIAVFALRSCQSCVWWRVEEKWNKVQDFSKPFLFRDDSVPQSSNWRILGPPEGGHKERPEHPRWWRHDSHFTGCFPRTYWCPPAYMQQRVSFINSTSFKKFKICTAKNLKSYTAFCVQTFVNMF